MAFVATNPAGATDQGVKDEWRQGIRLALRLSTAHHPLCGWFKNDTYRIARIRVCRGCALAAPTFLFGFLLALFWLRHDPALALHLGALGLLLGIPHATTYLKRFHPAYRAFAKLTGGTGLGLLLPSILLVPLPMAFRITALIGLGAAFLLLQGIRIKKMLNTCDACPYQRDWARCPGFAAPANTPSAPITTHTQTAHTPRQRS